jgi:hypothetical protein
MNAVLVALPDCIQLDHVARIVIKLIEIVLAGAFGGVANAVSILFEGGRIESEGIPTWEAARGVPTRRYLVGQAVVGAGGAFAAVFGLLTIGNAVQAGAARDITDFPIYLVALCVVGGFIGNKLLAGVSKKLLDQIAAAEEDAKQAKAAARDAEKLASGSTLTAEIANNVAIEAKADAARTRGLLSQFDKVLLDITSGKELVQQLEDIHAKGKPASDELRTQAADVLRRLDDYARSMTHSRTLVIVRANLNFDLGLVNEAFAVLETFLADRRSAGLPEDDDDAVAWFNIACYGSVLSTAAENGERSRLLAQARDALGESLRIDAALSPEALASRVVKAEADSDLSALRATSLFGPVMAPYGGKKAAAKAAEILEKDLMEGKGQSPGPAAESSAEEDTGTAAPASGVDTAGQGEREETPSDDGGDSNGGEA